MTAEKDEWTALLEEFVDARIDADELLERAGKLLPAGADAADRILTGLAEGEWKLRPPAGRLAFIRRLEQFAADEAAYAELDLWCFALWQTDVFAPEAEAADPETALLQEVLHWMQEWEEEETRPASGTIAKLADILAKENDPAQCLERMEEALERSG